MSRLPWQKGRILHLKFSSCSCSFKTAHLHFTMFATSFSCSWHAWLSLIIIGVIITDYHWCDYHWLSLLWLSWSSLCSKQSCHIFLKLLVAPFLYFDNQGGKNITLQNMTTLLTSSASWAIKYLQVSYDSACNAIYLIGQNMVKTPQLWVLSCIWQCFPYD